MAWTVAPNIKALFASVNKIAPGRDKASDGTIGDYAHSTGTSGHNPDDTSGTRAERSDSDTVAEVRAGDIDKDLRVPGLTMEQVVQTVVRTAALRKRLIYVIYNRRIWSASNGWRQVAYSGSNPHDKHAHFSGHPDYDNDSSPWREIEALAQEDDMSEKASDIIEAWAVGVPKTGGGATVEPVKWRLSDEAWQRKTDATLTAVLAAAKGLNTEQILARIDQVAAAESERDSALLELVRAGQSGELTAEQVLVKLRDLLPADTSPHN